MSVDGALLFARYAYPPNELGYCGPDGATRLLQPQDTAEIARRATGFEGAWTYLEVLAEAAGVADPLDEAVVEAYWVGNDLVHQVDGTALLERLQDRFRGQTGGVWHRAGDGAVPHHSFHVYDVYPWSAMLGSPARDTALSVLAQCRVRPGRVLAVEGERADVLARPLEWDGTALVEGAEEPVTTRWSVDGRSLIATPAAGDLVALHWDWVCDVISGEQAARLEALDARARDHLRTVMSEGPSSIARRSRASTPTVPGE
jgi:hypothetical protein